MKNKKGIVFIALAAIAVIMVAIIYFVHSGSREKLSINPELHHSFLAFTFTNSEEADEPFALQSVLPAPGDTNPQTLSDGELYTLYIFRDKKQIHKAEFTVPVVHGETFNPDTGRLEHIGVATVDTVRVITPYFEPGFDFIVRGANRAVLQESVTEFSQID